MRFALLVFYAAGTLAAPVLDGRYPRATVPDVECKSTRFRQDTTFEYEYDGETINSVEGASTKSTGLKLTARVLVTQLTGCEFHMKLSDVKLRSKSMNEDGFTENAESAALKSSLEKNSILFSMEGNTITAVRPHVDETTESVNIKRGIISTFQLDENSSTETDINGECPTTVTNNDGTIVKTKSLSSCSNRVQNEIGIQSSSIKTEANLKPLDSKSDCTYALDGETISSVTCVEKHVFKPFSAGYKSTSGAMTVVNQKVKLIKYDIGQKIAYLPGSFTGEKSLLFEHTPQEDKKQAASLNEQVEEVMNRLIDQSHLSAKQSSAHDFTSLVMLFRKMSESKISFVWERYFDCVSSRVCGPNDNNLKDLYRQYMLDAIAYCGTSSCVSVVKGVTINGEVAGERANMFLQSIALVAKTTNSMIRDILEIAEKKPSRQVYLTLGTLISRHCAKTPDDCAVQSESAIIKAENHLERILGDCSGQDNHVRVEEILMVLKAIGNAKRPINARTALIRCAKTSQHTNITMSAFDALRGMPCDKVIIDELRDVITDANVDADTRIYAFQASMRCPTKENLERLVHQYNLEMNNQLNSFMQSYFANLLASSDPANKVAKDLLSGITKVTQLKEVDLPFHQYSKNFEKSFYLESIKTGATVKSNLIFHPDGFLPKSAMFNVSAQVMGVPVDLIETAVGIDGAEALLENVFGPDGAMPENFVLNMFDWKLTAEKFRELAERKNAKNRERRAARPLPDGKVNDIHEAINKKPVQPSGFLSLKVMGQEVRMMSYDDIYALIDQVDNMNVIQLLLNVAKGGEKTFSKSVMFLEMTHTVPTGVGLPLKLKLSGTTVATVELSGKFDIRNMFWGKGALAVNGFVKPSAVVEISGSMGVESKFISTGLLVSSNMMVSNTIKGSINYKQGQLLKVNLDTPSEPVQLFKFSSTPYMFMNTQTDMIEGVPRVIKSDECLKSQLIGYGLCTSVRVPVAFREYESPYFPLSGPAHVGVSLVRGDEKLTTFQFLMTMTKNANSLDGEIEMSTPGAVYERKVSGRMRYSDVDNTKALVLSTEKFGRSGSVSFSYNKVTQRTAFEAKNNFFTPKDVVSRIVYFNRTSLDNQQYGVELSFEYDWYKFEHVVKYVRQPTRHSLVSKTVYYPNDNSKVIRGSLEYNTQEKVVTANIAAYQIKQEVELTARWDNTIDEKGLILTATHKPTGKTATFYVGYKSGADKAEIMTTVRVFGKTIKNILGWYKNGDIQSIEDFFLFNGKTAKFVAALENKNGEKALEFSANVLGKTATSTILYTNEGTQKIIEVTVEALKQKASSSIVLTNGASEKSIKITTAAVGKTAQAKLGYYTTANVAIFKYEADILGKHAEVSLDLKKGEDYRSILSGVIGDYAGGVRNVYTADGASRKLCEYIYYGTKENSKDIMMTCIALNDLSKPEMFSKELALTVDIPALKKKSVLTSVLSKRDGRVTIAVESQYNDKALFMNNLDIDYKDPSNRYVSLKAVVGKLTGEVKAYIQKQVDSIDFGFQLSGLDQTLLLLNRYSQADLSNAKDSRLETSIVVNGKSLPVTTVLSLITGKGVVRPTIAINVGKYSLAYSTKLFYAGRYGLQYETLLMKENIMIFKAFNEILATTSSSKKEIAHKFGLNVLGKEYSYGWEVAFEKQNSENKRAYLLLGKVQYAANRKSSVYISISDSDTSTTVVADVEYIPTKRVRHSIRFTKAEGLVGSQLDVNIEFLPKMFAKFMARLEDVGGYKLVTKANLEWDDFKPIITLTNSYVNDDKVFAVSSGIAQDTFVSLKFDKFSTITLTTSVLGNTAKWIGEYKNKNGKISFAVNDETLFHVGYDQIAQSLRFFGKNGQVVLLDMQTNYNKLTDAYKLVISSLQKWSRAINPDMPDAVISMLRMNNRYINFHVNKKEKSLVIKFIPLQAQLKIKYASKTKELIVSMTNKNTKCSFVVRADWNAKVLGAHAYVNKAKAGTKVVFAKQSVIVHSSLKLTSLHLRSVASFKDSTLRFALKRNNVNEAVFEYALSKEMCELALKWNTETLREIAGRVKPAVRSAVKQVLTFISKLRKQYADLDTSKLSKEAKAQVLKFISRMENAFDEYDFIAARDQIGKSTLIALNKLSAAVVKAYNSLASSFDKLKQKIPITIERLQKVITDVKALTSNIDFKVKKVLSKVDSVPKIRELIAKELTPKIKVLIAKGKDMLKVMKVDLNENLIRIVGILSNVVTNLTDASRPVVEKAIILLKDFKIRGKRLEDIVKMAKSDGEKYIKIYVEKVKTKVNELRTKAVIKFNELKTRATIKLNELKEKATIKLNEMKVEISAACDKATEYILKLNVPYTDKTVAQVIKLVKETIAELKQTIKNMDINKLTNALKVKIMAYKIKGKTIVEYIAVVRERIAELKQKVQELAVKSEKILKDLPETTRKALKDLVGKSRIFITNLSTYLKIAEGYVNEISDFATPLRKYLTLVCKSVKKHFGPLYEKAVRKMAKQIETVKLPVITPLISVELKKMSAVFVSLMKPIVSLIDSLKTQVRMLNINGFRLGPMVDMQMDAMNNVIEKIVFDAKTRMQVQMGKLNTAVKNLKSSTPEQVIDTSIDKSVEIVKEIVSYVNKMINDKETIKKQAIENIKRVYDKLVRGYKKATEKLVRYQTLTVKSIDQISAKILKISSKNAKVTAKEFSRFIKQIVAMDISQSVWDAWTSADIMDRLEKYRINDRIDRAIQLAKDANITDIVSKTIDTVEEFIKATAQQSYVKALQNYAKVENVILYLKSIPKENYYKWLEELRKFTLTNKESVTKLLVRVSEASRQRAIKAYEDMEKLSRTTKQQIYKDYVVVAKQWYDVIAEKSQLVYNDVKQPTIEVYQHYNSIIGNFIKAQYELISKRLTTEFTKLYNDLDGRLAELKTKFTQKIAELKLKYIELKNVIEAKVNELQSLVEARVAGMKENTIAMYDTFMNKYGDLSWEDVANKVEELGMEQYNKAKVEVVAKYKKLLEKVLILKTNIKAKVLNMKAETLKLYQQTITEYNTIVAKVQGKYIDLKQYVDAKLVEIKIIITEAYKKYEAKARIETQKLILKAKTIYADIKAKVTGIYIQNKDKTLKKIYTEVKKFILDNYMDQRELMEALAKKNYVKVLQAIKYVKNAKAKSIDLYNNVIAQATGKLAIIVPELKYEVESIINQTLRNAVIMTKVIIKAYTPHVTLVGDAAKEYTQIVRMNIPILVSKAMELVKRYIEIIKSQAPVIIEQAKQIIKIDISKLKETLKVAVRKLEQKLRKLIGNIMESKSLTKYIAIVEERLGVLNQLIQQKVEALKRNPTFIDIKAKLQATIAQGEKLIKERLQKIQNSPKFIEMKAKVYATVQRQVVILQKVVAAYKKELERLVSDAQIDKVIAILKQVQVSAMFTAEKLQENLKPYIDNAVKTLITQVGQVPKRVNQGTKYFADAPEDTFWSGVAVTREAINSAYLKVKSVEKKQVVSAFNRFFDKVIAFSVDIAMKSADQWTKKTAITLYIRTTESITKLKAEYKRLNIQYEQLIAKVKILPAYLKAYYEKNMIIAKALIEENMLIAKSFAEKNYASAILAITQQWVELKDYWKNSPWKAIPDNQIWGEIATEITNHELVDLAKGITRIVLANVVIPEKLVAIYKANKAIFEKKYAELEVDIAKKYAELKLTATQKYTEIKEKFLSLPQEANELFKKAITKYNELVANAEKIFEETTIAEIVAFIQKQYIAALKKVGVTKVEFNTLKVLYTIKARELYAKYEMELKNAFKDAKVKVLKLVEEYKGMAMKSLMPYYSKVQAKVMESRAKVMGLYNKYRPIIERQYKQLLAKVVVTFNKIKAMVEAKYQQLDERTKVLAAKTMIMYNKYRSQVVKGLQQLQQETSAIRAKLLALKKMTIRQTVEALRKSIIQAKELGIARYNVISAKIIGEYQKITAKIEEVVKELTVKLQIQRVKVMKKVDEIVKTIKPYLLTVNEAYKMIEEEVRETAIFVYRYYNVESRLNAIKAIIASEVKRILTDAKRMLDDVKRIGPMIPATLKKYTEVYRIALKKSAAEYADQYKKLADVYARDARQFARDSMVRANVVGNKAIVAIQNGLKYVQNIDIEKMKDLVRDMVTEVKKYVSVTIKDGEVIVKIIHADVVPTAMRYFSIAKLSAKKTFNQLKSRAKLLCNEIQIQLLALKQQAEELISQIQTQVMESTSEIRRDFRIIFKVNKNISKRIYHTVKALMQRHYGNALAKLNGARTAANLMRRELITIALKVYVRITEAYKALTTLSTNELYDRIVTSSKNYLAMLKRQSRVIDASLQETIKDILARGVQLKEELTPYYARLYKVLDDIKAGVPVGEALKPIVSQTKPILEKYKNIIVTKLKEAMDTMKEQDMKLREVLKPYVKKLTVAYEELRAGVPVKQVIKSLLNQLKFDVNNIKLRAKACKVDTALCKMISESVKIHEMILRKYIVRVKQFMSLGKAHVDRAYRKLNKVVQNKNFITGEKYLATAMIMGNHILTFDNKFYDFVDPPKAGCSYLLARDFQGKKFTLRKVDGAIIVETPDMTIKIRNDGRTKATVGNEVSFSLPVDSGASACVRVDNLILCHFKDQQMKITVDLKNFFTIISVSEWYQGKSQGLLGTFNHESHDDWRLPSNNKIATNVNEFANAYELTGSPKCVLKLTTDHAKTCNRPANKRCAKTFKSGRSPLASFFDLVDPKPFMEACKLDTQCRKAPKKHCSVVAAYITVLRTKGIWVPQLPECMSEKGRSVNEQWVQKSMNTTLDVVVMVSQRKSMKKRRDRIIPLITHLHRMFKSSNYSVRFALIGFGGKGVHEPAHTHPLRRGQTVFGYIADFRKGLKSMPFKGQGGTTNDAYHAILMASKLKFRQGAEKAFILFNSEPHSSHESGPSYDEASYILQQEANAPLFAFDRLNFPSFGKAAGRVIGETTRKLYTTNNLQGVSTTGLILPASEFKKMALSSKGGLFSNRLKVPKQIAISLHDALLNWVIADSKYCKRCTLRSSWTGLARPVCVSIATTAC